MLHTVLFRKENVTIRVADGANLRRACLDSGIDPYPVLGGKLSCHGKGLCGTCAVAVDRDESLTPPGKREAKWLKKHDLPGLRLSCQAQVKGDLIVTTGPDTKPAWKAHPFYSGRPVRSWDSAA
ncbi:MAG TPA: 2Fe-2S iron-sulfur cluster-binding protein [Planctomycetota bacterium]|nr:2Fe-2S iron-sulfur cluster-binding protein [Planctomycetota bacterium]